MRILYTMVFSILLVGCTASIVFPAGDTAFIEYEYGDYGPDLMYNLYPETITLFSNGQGNISTPVDKEIGIDQNAPHTVSFEIGEDAVQSLQDTLEERRFFSLSEDLSEMEVMDGGYEYLTVFTEDKQHTIGGNNPNNETLDILTEEIIQVMPDGTITSFNEGIEASQKQKGLRE